MGKSPLCFRTLQAVAFEAWKQKSIKTGAETMNHFPHYGKREVQTLDGFWDFTFLGEQVDLDSLDVSSFAYDDLMSVPGVFDNTPKYAGKRGTAAYRTRFRTTEDGERLLLKLGGIGLWCKCFLDGESFGVCDMPYSGVEFETCAAHAGFHELVLVIDNRFDFARVPLFSQYYDFYAYGGIYREVEIHRLGDWNFDRVSVRTQNLKTGRVELKISLQGDFPSELSCTIGFDDDPAGSPCVLSVKDGVAFVELQVPDFQLWSPDSPHLHTVTVRGTEDVITERFGIRTVGIADRKITINGVPVKLLGFCRHESHLEFGPVQPDMLMIEDLQNLKELGCNFIRGSHYPQSQRFLDLCDQLGILYWEESLGWGNRLPQYQDPAFVDAQVRQTAGMIHNSINHACIILWGFLNEGESWTQEAAPVYRTLFDVVRTADPTRLATYASMGGNKDIMFGMADVICLNAYPGWYAQDREKTHPVDEIVPFFSSFIQSIDEKYPEKPFLISEVGAGAIYGWRDRYRAHWSEEYQCDYLETICRFVKDTPRVAGLSIWHFADARTYTSSYALGRPRTINDKGILDSYRRPKLAFDVVRRIFRDE